ncbi:MAG TPA: EamA family transporter [Gemmatimonadota bacterium]|nr:EamA family transporter [Gemmatimonadota bacterium]
MSAARTWSLFGLLAFIWGSTWLVIKIGLADLPPFLAAGLRFALAAGVLAVVARARRIPFPRDRREHALLLGVGTTMFWASYGIVYWAEQYIPSGLTAVLFATHPFFTLILAHLVLSAERITARRVLGVGIGFLGVALVFSGDLTLDHPRGATAAAVLLLAPLASAAGNVTVKRWGTHLHPFQLSILPMAYGAAALLGSSLVVERGARIEWSPVAVGSVLYLAILGSVIAFVGYYTLLREVAVTTLNLMSYVYPVVAVVLGYLILDEILDRLALAGAGLVLVGIAVATRRRRR